MRRSRGMIILGREVAGAMMGMGRTAGKVIRRRTDEEEVPGRISTVGWRRHSSSKETTSKIADKTHMQQ